MEHPQTILFYKRNLPHWHVANRSYFITFRLKNSIPVKVIEQMRLEYENLRSQSDPHLLSELQKRHFRKYEQILDSSREDLHLKNPEIAGLVMNSFDWLENNSGWKIPSAVIMPNHVHCLMSGENAKMSFNKALSSLKGFTARQANTILNTRGPFWSPENFDHWCRTPEKEESVKKYIRNNPVKAGLVCKPDDWPWLSEK